jgi:chromosome partitioning protein
MEGVDFVFFDHAPSYSPVTDAALLASTEMLIPVQPETFSMLGLLDMIEKLQYRLGQLEHEVEITGIVPSNLDFTKLMTQVYLDSLRKEFGEKVTQYIHTDANISKAQSFYQTIYEYNPRSKAAQDYMAIADYLMRSEVLV